MGILNEGAVLTIFGVALCWDGALNWGKQGGALGWGGAQSQCHSDQIL